MIFCGSSAIKFKTASHGLEMRRRNIDIDSRDSFLPKVDAAPTYPLPLISVAIWLVSYINGVDTIIASQVLYSLVQTTISMEIQFLDHSGLEFKCIYDILCICTCASLHRTRCAAILMIILDWQVRSRQVLSFAFLTASNLNLSRFHIHFRSSNAYESISWVLFLHSQTIRN